MWDFQFAIAYFKNVTKFCLYGTYEDNCFANNFHNFSDLCVGLTSDIVKRN